MSDHPITDAMLAEYWPGFDHAEIRRQYDVMMEALDTQEKDHRPRKQSSVKASALAGRYMSLSGDDINEMILAGHVDKLAADIRSLAASVVSQDETKGDKHG